MTVVTTLGHVLALMGLCLALGATLAALVHAVRGHR